MLLLFLSSVGRIYRHTDKEHNKKAEHTYEVNKYQNFPQAGVEIFM